MIWAASSRVGARISARVLPRGRSISICTSGNPKAADLPLPVAALASRSRPLSAGGIEAAWTGVGSVKPSSATARRSCGRSPRLSKGEMSFVFQKCAIDRQKERTIARVTRHCRTSACVRQRAKSQLGLNRTRRGCSRRSPSCAMRTSEPSSSSTSYSSRTSGSPEPAAPAHQPSSTRHGPAASSTVCAGVPTNRGAPPITRTATGLRCDRMRYCSVAVCGNGARRAIGPAAA